MKTDLKVFFSCRFLRLLVLISLFTRLFFQFKFLPKTPSEYGPDEATYAALAKYVTEGLPVQEFPGYGAGLYNSAKALILPSSVLIKIGINELLAVRLISTLAGLISLIMLSLCIIAIQYLIKEKDGAAQLNLNRGQVVILSIFAFLPSNFLWSNLGLRESSSQLYLIAFTYFFLKLLSPKAERKPIYSILSSISLMLAFGSRPETAMAFSLLAIIFGLVLLWKLREVWILVAIFVGFTAGLLFTTTPTLEAKETLMAVKISNAESKSPTSSQSSESKSPTPSQSSESKSPTPSQSSESKSPTSSQSSESKSPTPSQSSESKSPTSSQSSESKSPTPSQSSESKSPTPSQSSESKSPTFAVIENFEEISKICAKENQVLILNSENYKCIKSKEYKVVERSPVELAKQQVLTTQILEYKRNVNRIDAASALPESACIVSIWKIPREFICNLIELPYRLPTFLFRPLPLIDSGSSFLNLAGVENLLWLVLLLYSAFAAFKKNLSREVRFLIIWLYSYIMSFSIAASLYEGNLGTAFRHKSSILWALTLVLLISYKDFKIVGRDSKLFWYRHSKKE
jgi:hypothetical protein